MKSIIHGLRYDTDKAIRIGEAGPDCSVTDFQWWEAALYRTPRSGRYFLAGKGGPMTRFAHSGPQRNETRGGSAIFPMERAEALAWSEEFLTTAEIEAGFSDLSDA